MDPSRLEERFRERAAESRRQYVWFLGGALVVSLAIVVGNGLLLYWLTLILWVRVFLQRTMVPPAPFLAIYLILFLSVGYRQYRESAAAPAAGPDSDFLLSLGRWGWINPQAAAGVSLAGLLFTFPALIFHFLKELFTGRHLFASKDVERLAFEILLDGGARVSPEFLQDKYKQDPETCRRAIRLLLEMNLLVLARREKRRVLLRSLEGEEFLGQYVNR